MAETTGMNGTGETVSDLIRRIDAEQADSREAELLRHQRALEAKLDALNAKIEKLTTPPPERRSTMSARRKSELIRKLGVQGYQKLPW